MSPTIHPACNCGAGRARMAPLVLGVLIAWIPATVAWSDGQAPPSPAVDSWQNAERITPEELAQILRSAGAEKPAIYHVGYRVLFAQAHIPGSQYAGPGSNQTGLNALMRAVSALPKTQSIVLYCGCCPWKHCPNLEQPWAMLQAAGFTRVKVLYMPKNFGVDWVQKGYPVEASDPSHG
jgi:thiosulfate/3-mercaptopyruvate sulfurtransferase